MRASAARWVLLGTLIAAFLAPACAADAAPRQEAAKTAAPRKAARRAKPAWAAKIKARTDVVYWSEPFEGWMAQSRTVLEIPFKRHVARVLDYLEKDEVAHIFRHLDPHGRNGLRDLAALRLLYNTGARAGELVSLDINQVRFSGSPSVRIRGKGYKERTCPLWPETIKAIRNYLVAPEKVHAL